ncbi:MAG TPA: hypothetical protein VNM14_25005 [Planctomycetota bacterium]|nr:hypothetical protein [Planctomycetota bacterium]
MTHAFARPALLLLLLGSALPLSAQDKKKGAAAQGKVDQVRVDQAVAKGIAYLQTTIDTLKSTERYGIHLQSDELVLWTMLHAGVSDQDPDLQKLLKRMLDRKLEATYCVSLQALCLEELDRVKYQGRIARCAQFLLDNQCKNGQWGYGSPSPFVDDIPTGGGRKDVASAGGKARVDVSRTTTDRQKPKVVRHIPVTKRRDGPDAGDNSNSQYAALGLRACHDAGIVLPKESIALASKWWRDAQEKATPGGWGYGGGGAGYGSMTAGAIGSLTIYHFILNEPWKADPEVLNGLQWLAKNFSMSEHPAHPISPNDKTWDTMKYFYYLYALERAGMLYETEKIGDQEWYPEGVKVLLESQDAAGFWGGGVDDTCFAILFLRRATRKLIDVASEDRKR